MYVVFSAHFTLLPIVQRKQCNIRHIQKLFEYFKFNLFYHNCHSNTQLHASPLNIMSFYYVRFPAHFMWQLIYNVSRKHVFHLLTDCSNSNSSSSSSSITQNKNRSQTSRKFIYKLNTKSRIVRKTVNKSANNKLIFHFIDEAHFTLAKYVPHFIAFDSIRTVCILVYLPPS